MKKGRSQEVGLKGRTVIDTGTLPTICRQCNMRRGIAVEVRGSRITGVPTEQIEECAELIAAGMPRSINDVGVSLEHQENGVNAVRAITCLGGLIGAVEAMLGAGAHPVKVLIVSGGNPVNTNPKVARAAEAFGRFELLMVRDLFLSETTALADYVLPAASFLERSELHLYSHSPGLWMNTPSGGIWPRGWVGIHWSLPDEIALGYCGLSGRDSFLHLHLLHQCAPVRSPGPYLGRLESSGSLRWNRTV
ncbi:MAG: molybdopterin-dependent oxidoreductase [Spirochaetales bacterium]|nr:molybdopterin-dependent oxidoreductase [Spirochaetales bacterium]